ncbi:hypothetical protein KC345_g1464 [Hortaea werneckii]|nr:hypothetical protein KC345_g1464 [Hortaea werneckii]
MAFLILFLLALAFGIPASTQMLTTTEFVSTGTCIKRSLLYTSGSSTYMLSEYGSTSNLAAPTQYACNATVTLPPITTTFVLGNASSPACSSLSGSVSGSQPLISDGGFESGNVIPFNTSSSSSGVNARIVQGGPIAPAAGSNYLLITYGASDSSDLDRRQLAFASVYNLTPSLSTSSGTTYTISANARQAPNGASEPNCYVILCVNDDCGTQAALTADYQLYSYTFAADADEKAIAALSFSCSGPAYYSYRSFSYAVFQNVTSSEYHTAERTFTAPGQNLTTERVSTVYSTAVHTTTAPASSILLTTTAITTSISTIYANITATSASTVFTTQVSYVTATASAIATETSYIYSRDTTTQYLTTTTLAISSYPPDTIVSTNERTLTQLEISYILSTVYTTVSTTITYTQNASTVTFTPAPETTTLEASIITFTPARETTTLEASIVTLTQARETTTLEASIATYTPPRETTTLDASTVTFTPYPETTTLNLTELATLTNVLTSYETGTETTTERFTSYHTGTETTTEQYTSYYTGTETTTERSTETRTETETTTTQSYRTDTATATTTQICIARPSPLSGGSFDDLSAWTVTSSNAGYTELRASGGSPGSYVEAHCDSPATGYGYDNGILHQTIQTCPGETYAFSYAYKMIDPNFNNYLNAFANGRYIISIRSGDLYSPDSAGNEYGQ